MNCNELNYFKIKTGEIEIVYCKDSKINYSEHNHISIYTIGIILNGEIYLKHSDKEEKLVADDFFLILPYEPHAICSGEDGYTMISVCIKKKFVSDYDKEKMHGLLYETTNILVQNELISSEHINAISEAIDMIYKQLITDKDKASFITAIGRDLEIEPEADISIDELAGKVFISKYHFIREFKKDMGLTPHRFQIQNRIRKAQCLLQEGKNLTEVALTTGFYDQSHFVRWFKQIVGITPTEYRDAWMYKIEY